jgi:uncharacterized membrane protein
MFLSTVPDYSAIPLWILLASLAVWALAIVGGAFLARTLWQYVNRTKS